MKTGRSTGGRPTTTISDMIRYVESIAGHKLNQDEGVQCGAGDRPLTGVTVAWMATPEAIEAAHANRHQLLLVHESLYYPYDVVTSPNPPPDWESWRVNRQRRELLERHGLSCLRIHGSADEICILDAFAVTLGLDKPVVSQDPAGVSDTQASAGKLPLNLTKVYGIAPRPLAEFVQDVKRRVGMSAVRVAGNWEAARMVTRVGVPWGGMGLFVNVGYQQQLLELGCDVLVAGESDNYGFRFAVESGIPMIETSHELSENPGLRQFTGMLAHAFPKVEFRFFENTCIWRTE